jgi:hypothetical protein
VSRDWDFCQFINIVYCVSWVNIFTTLRMGRRQMTLIHDCLLVIGRVVLARYHCDFGYYPQQ